MNRLKALAITLLALLLTLGSAQAAVKVADIFGSNMVLQRQTDAHLWGTTDTPKAKITITASWSKKSFTTMADDQGRWSLHIPTPEAGGPYSITIRQGSDRLTLDNVLIGEVWICSGQSNMEMPMKGFSFQPVAGATEVIVTAKAKTPIRMCTVKRRTARTPIEDCTSEWLENTPTAVASTSATAYLFAKRLQEVLEVPVGIVVSCWGGTRVESWMNRSALEGFDNVPYEMLDQLETLKRPHDAPTSLYNGMLHPIEGYTARGFLWYQGESNRDDAARYRLLMKKFVPMLREVWDAGKDMPFYYVQIAPYNYDGENIVSGALIREAQLQGLEDIENCGMAVTIDAGNPYCIHPENKQVVGDRLAYLALHHTYGMSAINPNTPTLKEMTVKPDGTIWLTFNTDKLGINPANTELAGFHVAGTDRVFYPAKAVLNRKRSRVEVVCEAVARPVALRYAFVNMPQCSLYNAYGIPVSPFRTDIWPDATYAPEP